jgi:hypothetical protein
LTFGLAALSALAGAGLVVAAFKFSPLNWIVDAPGWLVSRFVPIDFHEGEGAFGFVLAIFLSWLCTSLFVWFLVRIIAHRLRRRST